MAASNLLKRVRLGSDETDIECQKCSKIVIENIACSGCKLRYCLKCAKVNVALYNCIQAGDMDQFMWSCTRCRATFPSLENITSTLNDLKKSNENRFDDLESRVKTIEEGNKQDIEESVSTMKEDIIKSLKNDMDKVVDSRVKELEDHKRRDFNVLLFNMPEAVRNSPEEHKASDEESIKRLCTHLGLDNLRVQIQFRLGKQKTGSCRPLKVVLESKAHRKYLLDNAKYIQEKAPGSLKKVIIVRDLTPVQREERRERFANKRRSGQLDKQNRSGMTNPNPPSQFHPTAMEVNAELSPITSNANIHVSHLMSSTHLSHINHLADSQPTGDLTSAYNNSTVMDQTIIGGLSHR